VATLVPPWDVHNQGRHGTRPRNLRAEASALPSPHYAGLRVRPDAAELARGGPGLAAGLTTAELSPEATDAISHRGKALRARSGDRCAAGL